MLVIYLVHTDNERNSEMALVVELECLHQYFLSRSLKHIFFQQFDVDSYQAHNLRKRQSGIPTSFRTTFADNKNQIIWGLEIGVLRFGC